MRKLFPFCHRRYVLIKMLDTASLQLLFSSPWKALHPVDLAHEPSDPCVRWCAWHSKIRKNLQILRFSHHTDFTQRTSEGKQNKLSLRLLIMTLQNRAALPFYSFPGWSRRVTLDDAVRTEMSCPFWILLSCFSHRPKSTEPREDCEKVFVRRKSILPSMFAMSLMCWCLLIPHFAKCENVFSSLLFTSCHMISTPPPTFSLSHSLCSSSCVFKPPVRLSRLKWKEKNGNL